HGAERGTDSPVGVERRCDHGGRRDRRRRRQPGPPEPAALPGLELRHRPPRHVPAAVIMRASSLLLVLAALALGATAASAQLYWLDTNYGAPTLNRSDANGLGVTSV